MNSVLVVSQCLGARLRLGHRLVLQAVGRVPRRAETCSQARRLVDKRAPAEFHQVGAITPCLEDVCATRSGHVLLDGGLGIGFRAGHGSNYLD